MTSMLRADGEVSITRRQRLRDIRIQQVLNVLRQSGVSSVIDFGCGDGRLLSKLLHEAQLTRIAGIDISKRALKLATKRLRIEHLLFASRNRIKLIHGSITRIEPCLSGFDAATVIEVIEHLEISEVQAFERVLFEYARPKVAVVTTPNIEFNVRYANLRGGIFRHSDHRFEWSRAEFRQWATTIANTYDYKVRFYSIGEEDLIVGSPSQMAMFSLR
jgi:3' terminal RNA ribose 2'-O-methyltransferase Hen1